MSDMKRLLEKMDQFAGQAVGQKPGDQVRGTDKATKRKDNKHPFAGRLVGASESKSLLQDLEKELVEGAVKRDLAEQFAEFKESRVAYDKKTGQMGVDNTDLDQRHGLYINGKLVKTVDGAEAANNLKKRDPRFKDATVKKIAEGAESFDPLIGIDVLFYLERMYKSGDLGTYQDLMARLGDDVAWTNAVGQNIKQNVKGFTVNDFWTLDGIVRNLSDGYGLPEWFRIIEDGGWRNLIEKYKQYIAQRHGQSVNENEDDMFADRPTAKIASAIIAAGTAKIKNAVRNWKGDPDAEMMIAQDKEDGRDMIKVGNTFMTKGIDAGFDALYDLDTIVRDWMHEAVWKKAGIDLNDVRNLDESSDMCQVCGQTPCNCTHISEDVENFGYKTLHPEIFKARQKFPMAKSDMEALLMYVQDQEEHDIERVDRVNDREDAEIEQLDREENSLEARLDSLTAQIDKLRAQAKTVKEEVPAPVATAGGPAGANQPKTPPGVTPQVDPAQQALLKQNQSKLQQNLSNLKSAGVQIDPAKAAQTLQKTDTGAPMNAMDKDNIAAMAPAIGNVMANPQTATQLNTLIKKAGGGV